jgi:hypothetical protein
MIGLTVPRAPLGPPGPTPLNDILAGSDDGGATWQGGIIAEHRRDYGFIASSGVATDAQGACVAADGSSQVPGSQDAHTSSFRLIPAVGAQPITVGTLTGLEAGFATLYQASAGGTERFLAMTSAAIIRPCSDSCIGRLVTDVSSSHLIWTDVPG